MRNEDGASAVAVVVILVVVAALSVGTLALILPGGDDDEGRPTPVARLSPDEVVELRAGCRAYFGANDAGPLQRLNHEATERGLSLFDLCDALERRTDVPDEP